MLGKLISKLAILALKSERLSRDDITRVTNALLDNIGAIHTQDVISFGSQGQLFIGGKQVDKEQANGIILSARTFEDNQFRKILREQVKYEAIKLAVHNGVSPETIMFAKASLWHGEQENRILNEIIQG